MVNTGFVRIQDTLLGNTVKVDSSGSLQTAISGTANVAVQGTANVAVQGTADVNVQSGTVDVGSVSNPVTTIEPEWSLTAQRGSGSISNSASMILDVETDRVYVLLMNTGSVDVYVYPSAGVATTDIKLAPGDRLEFRGPYTGRWYGVTASGTGVVSAIEMKK